MAELQLIRCENAASYVCMNMTIYYLAEERVLVLLYYGLHEEGTNSRDL